MKKRDLIAENKRLINDIRKIVNININKEEAIETIYKYKILFDSLNELERKWWLGDKTEEDGNVINGMWNGVDEFMNKLNKQI